MENYCSYIAEKNGNEQEKKDKKPDSKENDDEDRFYIKYDYITLFIFYLLYHIIFIIQRNTGKEVRAYIMKKIRKK